MAVELATAYVSLAVETKGIAKDVSRSLQGTDREAASAGKRMGEGMSSGFSSSLRIAKIAATSIISAGVAAAGFGIKVAAANEQAKISFTTMLGSAKKADSFLKDLQAFAAKTPFEFPELQTAASSLISAGIEAGKVIPIMTTLGDVTSGMGTGSEGVKRATIALQQMSAAGRITGEDLNQLRDAGIPVYDLLASATGKSKEEIVKLAQAGKLGKKELGLMMEALESGKGLERFSGLMDAQSASLSGLWSTAKDVLGQGLATAVQPLIPLIKEGLGGATDYLAKVMPKVADGIAALVAKAPQAREMITKIKDGAQGLFDLIVKGDFTGKLRTAFGWSEDDPIVDKILDIRDAVLTTFDKFKNADKGGAVSGIMKSLGEGIGGVVDSLPALKPLVDGAAAAFKWMGENTDLVAKVLPVLLGLFVAYKGVMAANNVIGKESLVGFGLQLGTTIALIVANRQLASSTASVTAARAAQLSTTVAANGAEQVGLLTRLRSTAATVASNIASKAARAATIAWTGVQWLLNAALTANPIGLVVLAIVALIAIVVLAYKKNETFRNIVQAVWAGIKNAVGAVVDWFTNTAWPWIKKFIESIQTGFNTAKTKVLGAWDAVKSGLHAAWTWISQNVFDPLKRGAQFVVDKFVAFKDANIRAFNLLRDALKAGWDWISRNVFNALKAGLDLIVTAFDRWKRGVSTIWEGVKSLLKTGWDWISKNVFGPMKTGVAAVQTAFEKVKTGIKTAWDALEGIAKKPIKWIIQTVIGDTDKKGIIGAFNWLSDKIGGPHIAGVALPKGFKTGGVLPGYSPGRDIHRFFSATGGTLDLSGGEGILVPQATRALGGNAGIAAINDAARQGKSLSLGGYAKGGVLDWIKGKASSAFAWVADKASDVYSAVTNPLDWIKGRLPTIPGGKTISEYGKAAVNKGVGVAVGKVKDLWKSFKSAFDSVGGASGSGNAARNVAELTAAVKKILPDTQVSSGYRPGAITALGNVSQHSKGLAIDIVPHSTTRFDKIKNAFPHAYQLFYSPRDGQTLLRGKPWRMDAITKRDHWDHIHLSNKQFARGGVMPNIPKFDSGGRLGPGLNLINNATGADEYVHPDRGDIHLHVHAEELEDIRTVQDFLHRMDNWRNDSRKVESGMVSG